MPSPRRSPLHRLFAALTDNIVRRVVLYYALLFGGTALVWPHVPASVRQALLKSYAPNLDFATVFTAAPSKHDVVAAPIVEPVALSVAGAAIAAFLLALPVAWIYMLTRERKGYRQTVVHTLVLLPVVVAGVVVLVKTSVALAFSLAGIVAAVRFRNSLEDSKDAVFLFLVTGVGLACGVEIEVGVVISVLFNAMSLALFYSDFGRTPPALEGERAQRQMERALAIANRTSQFVARIDDEVLRAMAPAQLDALAGRVRKRREETAPDLPTTPDIEYDARLRIVTTDPDALRPIVEPILTARVKRWRLDLVDDAGDDPVLAYNVRWRKGSVPSEVVAALRDEGAPFVVHAEVS
jgi:hypothetical protein